MSWGSASQISLKVTVRLSGCYRRREQKRRGTHMARRTLYLPVMIAAAVLVACAVTLVVASGVA